MHKIKKYIPWVLGVVYCLFQASYGLIAIYQEHVWLSLRESNVFPADSMLYQNLGRILIDMRSWTIGNVSLIYFIVLLLLALIMIYGIKHITWVLTVTLPMSFVISAIAKLITAVAFRAELKAIADFFGPARIGALNMLLCFAYALALWLVITGILERVSSRRFEKVGMRYATVAFSIGITAWVVSLIAVSLIISGLASAQVSAIQLVNYNNVTYRQMGSEVLGSSRLIWLALGFAGIGLKLDWKALLTAAATSVLAVMGSTGIIYFVAKVIFGANGMGIGNFYGIGKIAVSMILRTAGAGLLLALCIYGAIWLVAKARATVK